MTITSSSTAISVPQVWTTGAYASGASQYIVYTTPAGTQVDTSYETNNNDETSKDSASAVTNMGKNKKNTRNSKDSRVRVTAGKNIEPKVFFKFVKSKLSAIDQDTLVYNLEKLKKLVVVTEEIGQQALFEKFAEQLAVATREQEALAAGYSKRIERRHIERFIKGVKDRLIRWEDFENFPRVIPANIMKQIKACQDTCIFDGFKVLFIDHTEEKEQKAVKTTKQKIKEKDPILFGYFSFQPEVFYYIVDWIDEICDLNFRDMLAYLKVDDPTI